MGEVTTRNFGLLIAFIIPGFIVIWGLGGLSPTLRTWLGSGPQNAPTVGGFLYVTLASVAAGVAVSALRWLVLDFVHDRTGVRQPAWDFSTFQRKQAAFDALAENHYRYYQAYGNSLVAIILVIAIKPSAWWSAVSNHPVVLTAGLALTLGLLFVASRDALRKYYDRTAPLLSDRH